MEQCITRLQEQGQEWFVLWRYSLFECWSKSWCSGDKEFVLSHEFCSFCKEFASPSPSLLELNMVHHKKFPRLSNFTIIRWQPTPSQMLGTTRNVESFVVCDSTTSIIMGSWDHGSPSLGSGSSFQPDGCECQGLRGSQRVPEWFERFVPTSSGRFPSQWSILMRAFTPRAYLWSLTLFLRWFSTCQVGL
jgi:hypothetical protein